MTYTPLPHSTIHEHKFCYCCGQTWRKNDAAHLCKQNGFGVRSPADRRAVNLLCHSRCHARQEDPTPEPVMIDGELLPPITGGMMVWMKERYDPEHFNRTYIDELFGRREMGKIEPPPAAFRAAAERERRRVG